MSVGALVPGLLLLGVPGVAHAGTFVVDDDMACPGAQVPTIQQAANAALPGDTIKVCAGTYLETVTVNKTLIFKGAKAGIATATRTGAGESTVKGAGGVSDIAFDVQANNVVIDGFTVKDADPGIFLHNNRTGAQLRYNIVKQNVFGVYLNSGGTPRTVIENNLFSDNNKPGAAAGNGIYSDQGLNAATIKLNEFRNNQNAGILLAQSAPINDVNIKSNKSFDNSSFVAAFSGAAITVTLNTTNDTIPADNGFQGSAVFIGGNTSSASVTSNTIKNSPFNGIAIRAQSNNVVVQANTVKLSSNDGISVSSSTPGGVSVLSNIVEFSQFDGISLTDTTLGDTVSGNTSTNNAAVDCRDSTVGNVTFGTANTWASNTGNTASPPGICVP
ncbi:MAG: right-handed parallel beta-helix repeat-containing protein [Acidimicrobiales bacterium]